MTTLGVILFLLVLGGVTSVVTYRKAYDGFSHGGRGVAGKEWHALPTHFGMYGFLRTAALAVLLYLTWQIVRLPVTEWMLTYAYGMDSTTLDAFALDALRSAVTGGNNAFTTLTAEASNWLEPYQALLARGDLAAIALCSTIALLGARQSVKSVGGAFQARHKIESWMLAGIRGAAYLSVTITALIFLSIVYEALLFFSQVPLDEFLFGLQWSPQTAIREGQSGASGLFGLIPLLCGTLLITVIALCVAVPIGLMSAVYLSEYAPARLRMVGKPMLEILAGIPTVVYGFFAVVTMAPFLRDTGAMLGLDVASESALAAGLVMGIMIIPLVSSLSDDALSAVPDTLRDASYGMGATQSETIRKVLLPAALPGIIGGILLAASRAIGETMIVVMAAGLSANLTVNPLESVTTITVQIVSLLIGDQEFGSTKTLAAFALGLSLFLFTLCLNIIALMTVRRYRLVYE